MSHSKLKLILESSVSPLTDYLMLEEGDRREAYMKYFRSKLEKWNVDSPSQLSDENKSKFFDEVSSGWKSEDEQKEKWIIYLNEIIKELKSWSHK